MFLWKEFMTFSQGFPFKHVKISISSALIHKYTLQQSFSLEKCATLTKPNVFFSSFLLFFLVGHEWIGHSPRLKLNMILKDLSSWEFCECACNYYDRARMRYNKSIEFSIITSLDLFSQVFY